MNIGQRIREVREDLGMQATVLARRAGVAPNTIYRIETGERTPSMALLEKIARELRTEPAELLREPVPLADAPEAGLTGQAEETGPPVVVVGATPEEAAEKLEQQLYAPARIAQGWHQLAQLFSDELEKVEKGGSEASSLEILIDTLENVAVGMEANVAAEKKELRDCYDDEDAVWSKAVLRPAIGRLSALIGEA